MEIETLYDLNNEIINSVYELDELQEMIKGFIYDHELTPDNQMYLSEIGDRHIALCKKVRVLLECFFVEEERAGLPKILSYRRLYKQLKLI